MRPVPLRGIRLALTLALLGKAGAALPASAESAFLMSWPANIGRVPATTYDDHGARLGDANLLMERTDAGGLRVFSQSGEQTGAHTVASAELIPVEPGQTLRLVRQESHSFDLKGHSLGILEIDHVAQRARCLDPGGALQSELPLPAADRVVNVPLNLLFMPLVTGQQRELRFQFFLCRTHAQILDFQAWVAGGHDSLAPVEVRYAPDFGMLSPFARQLVPKLSFWFDPRAPHGWIAHRLPLYTGGPEVLVVRQGVSTTSLAN